MLITVIRTILLYATVILSLRIMGKRQIGELQPSELVVAIMISDLATVPMESVDIPLLSGIIPVLTLILAEVLTSYMSLKSRRGGASGENCLTADGGAVRAAGKPPFAEAAAAAVPG